MPVDIVAFRKLILDPVAPKECVTRVTRVTASNLNDLAGHESRAERVTCVTEAVTGAWGHAVRDDGAHERVTEKHSQKQPLATSGHAVTRSRTKIRRETENKAEPDEAAVLNLEDWFTQFEERAAIREYEGGFDRIEAERLAVDDTIAMLGPRPVVH